MESEWQVMSSTCKINMDTSPEIYKIMQIINRIEVTNRSDAIALEKLIDTIGNITTHRTNRLFSSCERLPNLLQLFIVISSFLVILIFSFLPTENILVEFILKGSIIFAVLFVYLVIWDLSHPFKGAWSISNKPFNDLLKKL